MRCLRGAVLLQAALQFDPVRLFVSLNSVAFAAFVGFAGCCPLVESFTGAAYH